MISRSFTGSALAAFGSPASAGDAEVATEGEGCACGTAVPAGNGATGNGVGEGIGATGSGVGLKDGGGVCASGAVICAPAESAPRQRIRETLEIIFMVTSAAAGRLQHANTACFAVICHFFRFSKPRITRMTLILRIL